MLETCYAFASNLLGNLKDIVNIFFLILTAILAIKTLNNAKKTLFNPIRSEMIKYQLKLITDFIDKHTSQPYDFDSSIDYSNLLKLNWETDYLLDKLQKEANWETYSFDQLDSKILRYCKENLGGLFEIRQENDKIILQPVLGDFDTVIQYTQTTFIKEKEKKHKHLHLQRFYLTKRFYSFYNDLVNLNENPFVPQIIKNQTSALTDNIYMNVEKLYKLSSLHIAEQTKSNYQDIYSQFSEVKINHQNDLAKLRKTIADYFKVNGI